MAHLKDRAKTLNADQIYILHNHPTGDPKPSAADIQVTRYLCDAVPEIVGHVVINSGKFSLIGPDGQVEILPLENLPAGWKDPILQPSKPHEALNEHVNSAQKIAGWAKALTKDRGLPVLDISWSRIAGPRPSGNIGFGLGRCGLDAREDAREVA